MPFIVSFLKDYMVNSLAESCIISPEELIDAIEASLGLETDISRQGNEKWAESFGIFTPIKLSLKELTLISMKQGRHRKAIDLLAEVLALNIPINALEAVQNQGKTAFPNYRAIAYILYTRIRERLSELISIQKDAYQLRKMSDQSILAELIRLIMKKLDIPTEAAGFVAILTLIIAKTEFNAYSVE